MRKSMQVGMDAKMQECIEACQQCHDVCTTTVAHCLEMGGEHAAPDHIRMLLDCAEICQTSANFMIRMSDMHGSVCGVCAEICESCAEECERFGDDKMMQECAQVCRSCAESCQEMAAQM
ncbi:MAG: four-helix bundle copper-binding protein [Chloroflexi bacterium]|nr:MAG: four-helix bundle copper-binding protein [Chloroflexota bacterium]